MKEEQQFTEQELAVMREAANVVLEERKETLGRKGTYSFTTKLFPETYRTIKEIKKRFNIHNDTQLMEFLTIGAVNSINTYIASTQKEENIENNAKVLEQNADTINKS